ncbi:hypothetical protein D8B20_20725 (plasmid) [Candidatus Pantoea soli]|uniref:Uncharacterized protein n=1 Tax=Candidatus Pantoea soli TaxID=3098669 RepID=A0A518XJI5_9GAMM|nr:hypothetical protein D8B20_20725 [Pantoea soli]
MKITAIVGVSLLATSFHAAAFVSSSAAPLTQQVNIDSSGNAHAIPSETVANGVTKLIPVTGCNCPFCTMLRV